MTNHEPALGTATLDRAFASLSAPIDSPTDPLPGIRTSIRHRRQRRVALRVAAAVSAVALGGGVAVGALHPKAPMTTSPGSHGALTGATTSCARTYPDSLEDADWAADATVTAIQRSWFARFDSGEAKVTLTVHHWYRGGSDETLVVSMTDPYGMGREDPHPDYGIGTRLLLSGGTTSEGRTVATCGFTRYWDPSTAQVWSTVFG